MLPKKCPHFASRIWVQTQPHTFSHQNTAFQCIPSCFSFSAAQFGSSTIPQPFIPIFLQVSVRAANNRLIHVAPLESATVYSHDSDGYLQRRSQLNPVSFSFAAHNSAWQLICTDTGATSACFPVQNDWQFEACRLYLL